MRNSPGSAIRRKDHGRSGRRFPGSKGQGRKQPETSGRYLLYDGLKAGHEGMINPSLSRIQVLQNPLAPFPEDILVGQCSQCLEPACVNAGRKAPFKLTRQRGYQADRCVFISTSKIFEKYFQTRPPTKIWPNFPRHGRPKTIHKMVSLIKSSVPP